MTPTDLVGSFVRLTDWEAWFLALMSALFLLAALVSKPNDGDDDDS